jgi:hypothetical protein
MIKDAIEMMEQVNKDTTVLRRAENDFKKVVEKIFTIRYGSKDKKVLSNYTIKL